MPTIAVVDGIQIRMFYNDHAPAHFHAVPGDDEVLVTIGTLDVMRGSLPPARLRRVLDWALAQQGQLALNWIKCQDSQAPDRI